MFEDLIIDPFDQSCRKEMIIDYIFDHIKDQVRKSISDKIHEFNNLQPGDRVNLNYDAKFNIDYEIKK